MTSLITFYSANYNGILAIFLKKYKYLQYSYLKSEELNLNLGVSCLNGWSQHLWLALEDKLLLLYHMRRLTSSVPRLDFQDSAVTCNGKEPHGVGYGCPCSTVTEVLLEHPERNLSFWRYYYQKLWC